MSSVLAESFETSSRLNSSGKLIEISKTQGTPEIVSFGNKTTHHQTFRDEEIQTHDDARLLGTPCFDANFYDKTVSRTILVIKRNRKHLLAYVYTAFFAMYALDNGEKSLASLTMVLSYKPKHGPPQYENDDQPYLPKRRHLDLNSSSEMTLRFQT